MLLTIVRHGVAALRSAGAYPGDDRPLTPEGIEKMREAAVGIARILSRPDAIRTSPMVRAAETARIIAAAFGGFVRIGPSNALLPGRSPQEVLRMLSRQPQTHTLIVGHEPSLSSLMGLLLGCGPDAFVLKKGGAAHFEIDLSGTIPRGAVLWIMKSKHLRMLGKEKAV